MFLYHYSTVSQGQGGGTSYSSGVVSRDIKINSHNDYVDFNTLLAEQIGKKECDFVLVSVSLLSEESAEE